MKTIKMTNKSTGKVFETTTTSMSASINAVPYGQYTLLVTEDGHQDYTIDVTIDEPVETVRVKLIKAPEIGVEVFRSTSQPIKFTANETNPYLSSWEVKLEPNTDYFLETNYPGDLWVTNSLYIPTQTKMTSNKSPIVTTIGGGNFGVVGRPAMDGDGTAYSTNVTQFENGTYYFVIKRVD